MSTTEAKVIERVRKLLALSRSSNEHEAANAAAQAQRLMDEHRLEEAALRVESDEPAEAIVEESLDGAHSKKVAWRGELAYALASTMGAQQFWRGGEIFLFGRPSVIRTVAYLYQYLTREIARLADERDGDRAWKNAFRLGAAITIRERLYAEKKARRRDQNVAATAAPAMSQALAIIARDDAEVEAAYEKLSKGFGRSRCGSISSSSGYYAGQAAGQRIALNGTRPAIGAAPAKLGRAS